MQCWEGKRGLVAPIWRRDKMDVNGRRLSVAASH